MKSGVGSILAILTLLVHLSTISGCSMTEPIRKCLLSHYLSTKPPAAGQKSAWLTVFCFSSFLSTVIQCVFVAFQQRLYTVTQNYMAHQKEINEKMRYILVDWLVEVHLKFKLLPETMGLAVNLVDRFLSKHSVARDNLQLVGITCMFLAAKYEEIYPPECNDFVYISASAYSREQILSMEGTILNAVEFNLTVPTSLHFLRRFSKAASSDYPTHTLCKYLLELALVDMRMNKHYPSVIAAAAVYLARVMTQGSADWNTTLQYYTKYDAAFIHPVAAELLLVVRDAQTSNHQAVVRKYQGRKFGEVAKRPIPSSL